MTMLVCVGIPSEAPVFSLRTRSLDDVPIHFLSPEVSSVLQTSIIR